MPTKPVAQSTRSKKALSKADTSGDSFDNPLYDDLLRYVAENCDAIVNERFREWDGGSMYRGVKDVDPALYPKPQLTASAFWQVLVHSHKAGRSFSDVVRTPVGRADLVLEFDDYIPALDESAESFKHPNSFKVRWLLLCRPELSSVSKTMIQLNDFRDRETHLLRRFGGEKPLWSISSDQYVERYGVITANDQWDLVFAEQGYHCIVIEG